MRYREFEATIRYDDADRLFYGRVMGLREIVTFYGRSVDELEQAFHQAVDDYIQECIEHGVEPSRPFTGKLVMRLPAELHRRLSLNAEKAGVSACVLREKAYKRDPV